MSKLPAVMPKRSSTFATFTTMPRCAARRHTGRRLVPQGRLIREMQEPQFHLAWFLRPWPRSHAAITLRRRVCTRKAADQGNAKAQTMLGGLYHQGQGVGQDYSEAAIWFRKAAEQGFPDAQFKLGYAYLKGEGIPQDYAQAAVWYRRAAEQGHGEAQHNLGVLYAKGQGVTQDYAQAASGTTNAADQGLGKAQIELGRLYRNGQGVPQDDAQATIWFRKAADQGFADEQASLGGPSSQSASSGTRVVKCQNDEVLAPGWSSNCAHVWFSGNIVKGNAIKWGSCCRDHTRHRKIFHCAGQRGQQKRFPLGCSTPNLSASWF